MKNMKTLRVKMVGLLATALISFFLHFRADKPVITIFMIGDSTMANKKIDGGNPERGWGMVLPGFFSEDTMRQYMPPTVEVPRASLAKDAGKK